jgi:TPR repeat protein
MKKAQIQATASKVEARTQQSKNGVVGSEVENVNMPMQIIEEKVMLGKTKDAIRFIQELSDNGNSDAAYYLAKLFLEGDVIKKNAHKGVEYLLKAADFGNTKAKMEIAVSILRNGNDERDAEKAFEMFHDIAMKGNAEAEMVLSCLYFKGYGCEVNKTLADMWHLKARIDDFNENKVFEILGMRDSMNDNDFDNDFENIV